MNIFEVLINLGIQACAFGESFLNFMLAPIADSYVLYVKEPLTKIVTDIATQQLSLGGGDRNPLGDIFRDWMYDRTNSTVELILDAPRVFMDTFLDFPCIFTLFGTGLIVALIWRLITWILDIVP